MDIRDFNFKYGGQDYEIAKRLLNGKSREEVIKELFPKVAEQNPFIFRENIGGGRRRKPRMDQYRLFLYQVNRTIGKMERAGWSNTESYSEKRKWASKDGVWKRFRQRFIRDLIDSGVIADENGIKTGGSPPAPTPIPEPGEVSPVKPDGITPIKAPDVNGGVSTEKLNQLFSEITAAGKVEWDEDNENIAYEYDEKAEQVATWTKDDRNNWARSPAPNPEDLPVGDPEPVSVKKVPSRSDEIDRFYDKMMVARDFVMSRELAGEYLDFVSTRAVRDGAKAIAYGISVDEAFSAVIKTWPEDSRRELDRHERRWKPKPPTVDVARYEIPLRGAHQYLGYVMVLAQARVPIYLYGPSGCGKSFMARDLADALESEYGELPLTAGATPSWLVGAETISGYKSRPFVEIYEDGGVFCFEEIDAADPNMLLLVNNALANDAFTNPVTGEEIEKHDDFIPVATANTWGLGANRQFTGRERLDAATLDRWRVGRVEMDYDQKVEFGIVKHFKSLADKLEAPKRASRKAVRKARVTN